MGYNDERYNLYVLKSDTKRKERETKIKRGTEIVRERVRKREEERGKKARKRGNERERQRKREREIKGNKESEIEK